LPDDIDDALANGDPTAGDDPIAAAVATVDAQATAAPESIRNSPEYQALLRQNRSLARQAGTARKRETSARTEAENLRLAAEAQQQAVLEAQLESLPEQARSLYEELADIGANDPVAAANRLAEVLATVQSGEPGAGGGAGGDTTDLEATVPQAPTPPMSGGVDGNVPLSQSATVTDDEVIAGLDKTFSDAVNRNQDPVTRNRVTMKERAAGMIAYLGSAYIQATRDR
jgi:hypothetical protein